MSIFNIKTLCEKYSQVNHRERLVEVFRDFDRVLVTSSFGATSVILMHLLHQVKPDHPVHFIDTGFHFPETIDFAKKIAREWGIKLVFVKPDPHGNALTRRKRSWTHDPDRCCRINKVSPLNRLKRQHDVWISGMIGGTNDNRQNLPVFKFDGELFRFYPLIDFNTQEAELYQMIHELPKNPLVAKGYGSIGCSHCTQKGEGRRGRWAESAKTECGLHKF